MVLTGGCTTSSQNSEIWRFELDNESAHGNGTWSKLELSRDEPSTSSPGALYGSTYLSAGFSFTSTTSPSDLAFYVFGGMCTQGPTSGTDWTSSASYSNTVLAISSPTSDKDPLTLSAASTSRAAPIPEAGLSITPLAPTFSNESTSNPSQNQNFVLIGGHTQNAFINMSQVALLSLPEASWTYLGIDPATNSPQGDLLRRASTDVEPRSGHTAVLTPDGSRIVVFGGWVGDVHTPATPQLAVLEVGAGYGGSGDWRWSIPSATTSLLKTSAGIYGHGAAMLPGGVMMITGGYSIPGSTTSRFRYRDIEQSVNTKTLLFNTTSLQFVDSYNNPHSSSTTGSSADHSPSGALSTTPQKVGLGTGLALGFSAVAGVVGIYFWYSRKMRRRTRQRESELRELALGAHRYYHEEEARPNADDVWNEKNAGPDQGSIKRKPVPTTYTGAGNSYPWAPSMTSDQQEQVNNHVPGSESRSAERTGLFVEIPSPTRGLRRSLHSRPMGYTPAFAFGSQSSPFGPGHGSSANAIHPIDEQEEYEEDGTRSVKKSSSAKSLAGGAQRPKSADDPFRDPPPEALQPSINTSVTQAVPGDDLNRSPSQAKRDRNAEIQGWVDDWTVAAADMNLSHNNSVLSRNLSSSKSHSHSNSQSHSSGRGSPEKSDRTGSNLSEASMLSSSSIQRSNAGSILLRRDGSGRSVSVNGAAQNLFAGAAAAMAAGVAGGSKHGQIAEHRKTFPSATTGNKRRSVSYGTVGDEVSASRVMQGPYPRVDFSPQASAKAAPWEKDALLRADTDHTLYVTPPESPIKDKESSARDRSNSMGGTAAKALGFLGTVKRALTGGQVGYGYGAVKKRVEEFEEKDKGSRYSYWANEANRPPRAGSPSEMVGPRRTMSAGASFWRGKKGRKDWDDGDEEGAGSGAAGKDESSRGMLNHNGEANAPRASGDGDESGEEWDVEGAVQRRVVQVMFTVPKERLRVVNCDPDGNSVVTVEAGEVGRGEVVGEGEMQPAEREEKGKSKGKERADE